MKFFLIFLCSAVTLASSCHELWYNKCENHDDCCSKNCEKESNWKYGLCKPEKTPSDSGNVVKDCENDWFNKCRENKQCCSGLCDKNPDWEFGICKPKPNESNNNKEEEKPAENKCESDWYNKCVNNDHCCSKFCDKDPSWQYGVCKPKPDTTTEVVKCEKDWFNECVNHKQCCSGFCDKEPDWKFGVCKQKPVTNNKCLGDQEIGCVDRTCCGNLKCSKGPLGNWKMGMCLDPTTDFSENKDEEIDPDSEDDLEYYKRFVQDKLFVKNDHVFDGRPLRCRDVDPLGEYFYNYNKTHSFRICDVCAELPFKKLENVRIGNRPLNQTETRFFQECFGFCTDDKKCVALSFDSLEGICQIFDSIEGNYDEESDWTTVILTQPVFLMKDYLLSRHTQVTCENKPNREYVTNDVMDCFSYCEAHNCDVVTYDNKACKVYLDGRTCKDIYYRYGQTSLFYRQYFHGNDNDWRFIETSQDDEEEEDEFSDYKDILQQLNETGKGSRTRPKISQTTLDEIKEADRNKLVSQCFDNCVNAQVCTGVLYNPKFLNCRIIDWKSLDLKKDLEDKGFQEYRLIHHNRNNILYGYDINSNVSLNQIFYDEKSEVGDLSQCVQKCSRLNKCIEVYFNLGNNNCLTIGEFPGRNLETIKEKKNWISLKNDRTKFNSERFKFAIVRKNQYLENNLDGYVIKIIRVNKNEGGIEKCFDLCNRNSDQCLFLQISRSENSIECKIYREITGNEEWKYQEKVSTDLYVRVMASQFNGQFLEEIGLFNKYDAGSCFPDEESITKEGKYLYGDNLSAGKSTGLAVRNKRGIFDAIGKFFKGIGEAIISIPKKIVQTGIQVGKAIGKAVQGKPKEALKEFRDAPLVKDAEDLYHNVKKVGEGIGKGDIKKVGEGLLGVVTNDLTDFIPGAGIAKKGGKAIAKGIKGAVDSVGDKAAKKGAKDPKKEISKKNDKKSDEKQKKDDKEKKDRCEIKKRHKRAAAGDKRKRDDCDDDCPRPNVPQGLRGKLITPSLDKCKGSKPGKHCPYLCNAGYDEDPNALTCTKSGNWDKIIACKPQDCGKGNPRLMFISSAYSLFDAGKQPQETLLYAVLFDDKSRVPLWSIAYHKWQIVNVKPHPRSSHFLQHPCNAIDGKQLHNDDFKKVVNPHGYQKGHLSPADLFRWNKKSANSGNLYINIAPQGGKLNIGSWKKLERGVQCASKYNIKAIVVTGVGGKVVDRIGVGKRIEVREFFWKMVCYKQDGKTHVAAFIGNNKAVRKESDAQKKETLTARDQNAVIAIAPAISSNPLHNPWTAATQMLAKDKFNLIQRYPTPPECAAAMTLDSTQKQKWEEQFKLINDDDDDDRRRRRQSGAGAFCTKNQMNEFASFIGFSKEKEEDYDSDSDDGGDDDDDFTGEQNIPASGCGKRIVGYYTSWGKSKISASVIAKYTHIIFAFFEVQPNGQVVLGNPDYSSPESSDEVRKTAQKRLDHLLNIKDRLKNLKIFFAVGGWENSQYFSNIAANQNLKVTFIASVLKIIDQYQFDGFDVDWEYPVAGGAKTGIPEDKKNYVTLMSDLRTALDEKAKQTGREKYLLTFAGAAGETALTVGYDLPGLLKYADWVNVMAYDFFGPWDSKWGAYTGPPAPLYHGAPKGYSGKYNVNWAIKHYVCKVKSPKQIVMGIPFYGRYWFNVPAKSGESSIYRMANPVNGKFEGGFASWKDIKNNWQGGGFQHHFDQKVKSPYAYHSNGTYLGYESPESVKFKIEFAKEKGLGGLMVWEVGQDDDQHAMSKMISSADICSGGSGVNFKCIPIDEKRWWTFEENEDLAGLCGRSAPLYKGYYPVCDPDDLGYSCCGYYGYCGSGSEFCDCPTCVDYAKNPDKILEEPIKPKTGRVTWHLSNAPDGSRGRCGKDAPKVGSSYAICNPDDPNAHCCSSGGYCGKSEQHCTCEGCVDFKKNPGYSFS